MATNTSLCRAIIFVVIATTVGLAHYAQASILYDSGTDEFGVMHILWLDIPDPFGGTYQPVHGPTYTPFGYDRWLPKAEVNFVKLWAPVIGWQNVAAGPASADVTNYDWTTPDPNNPQMTYRVWRNGDIWISVNWSIYVNPSPPRSPAFVGHTTVDHSKRSRNAGAHCGMV